MWKGKDSNTIRDNRSRAQNVITKLQKLKDLVCQVSCRDFTIYSANDGVKDVFVCDKLLSVKSMTSILYENVSYEFEERYNKVLHV